MLSSWKNTTIFYGPGVKQGATIPYAELPDLAVLTNHLLELLALAGHHPRYIEQYLNTGTYTDSGADYSDYRLDMLELIE